MIDLHLGANAPRWRFLYAVRIDAYFTFTFTDASFESIIKEHLCKPSALSLRMYGILLHS